MGTIADACAGLKVRKFAKGELLLSEGGTDHQLFVLLDGTVSVQKGQTEIARISQREAIFGEISALLGIPHSASVVAETDVHAYEAEDGAAFLEANPIIAHHTARILAQRLYHATTYLADLKAQFADQSGHFAMMDQILDELMQQQRRTAAASRRNEADDPRL